MISMMTNMMIRMMHGFRDDMLCVRYNFLDMTIGIYVRDWSFILGFEIQLLHKLDGSDEVSGIQSDKSWYHVTSEVLHVYYESFRDNGDTHCRNNDRLFLINRMR